MVPGTGVEPVHADEGMADFKSAASTDFATRARLDYGSPGRASQRLRGLRSPRATRCGAGVWNAASRSSSASSTAPNADSSAEHSEPRVPDRCTGAAAPDQNALRGVSKAFLNARNERDRRNGLCKLLIYKAIFWRRGPESNRARRICNPLHNRFATAPWSCGTKKGKLVLPFLARHHVWNLERETRLELATSTLARLRSTN
jgi:hypothetical protein